MIVPCSGRGQGRSVFIQMPVHQCGKARCRHLNLTEQWERIQETIFLQELTSAAAREKRIDQPARVGLRLLPSHFLLLLSQSRPE
ncbi:MAG: hypothetical protein DMF32_10305 [Verrucomicrobia bacterium]|nr:MAG: hypothetical protein DMF32_10305 [Verrucomicrobiota bacterium]